PTASALARSVARGGNPYVLATNITQVILTLTLYSARNSLPLMGRGHSVLPRVLARIYLGDVLRYTPEQGSDARTVLLRDTLQPDDICELARRILRTPAES